MTLCQILKQHGSMTVEQIRVYAKRDIETIKRELQQIEVGGAVKFDGFRWSYNPRWKLRFN